MRELVRFAPVRQWEPAPLELPIGFPDGPRSQPPMNHEGSDEMGRVVIIESQLARFDRHVHAGLGAGTFDPWDGDRGLCQELAAAEEIGPGDPVALYDEGGFVIGRGALGPAATEPMSDESSGDAPVCAFGFHIGDIRPTESVAVEINGTRRATYRASDFGDSRWSISIPVGS